MTDANNLLLVVKWSLDSGQGISGWVMAKLVEFSDILVYKPMLFGELLLWMKKNVYQICQ